MNRLLKLTLLAFLFLGSACSYLDINNPRVLPSAVEDFYSSSIQDSSVFYYFSGKRIYLSEHKDVLLICFKDETSKVQGIKEIQSFLSFTSWKSKSQDKSVTEDPNSNVAIIKSNSGMFLEQDISKIKNREDVTHVSYLTEYKKQYAAPINQFLVKLNESSDYDKLETLVSKMSCKFIDKPWLGENVYLISVPKNNKLSAIDMANVFAESGMFKYSSPDFYIFDCFDSNDPYYNQQCGLWDRGVSGQGNDINIENAWTITEGSSEVSIAVIDVGVELLHPDLEGQLLLGYDATSNLSGGFPLGTGEANAHGTFVAGIIAAKKDNNIGIAGVAPNCKIIPINTANSFGAFVPSSFGSAINWSFYHGDADIINLSWSTNYDMDSIVGFIEDALSLGRDGKGCVVVASSSNDASATVSFPASLPYVLAVGSHDRNGQRQSVSNYGTGLNVVAPGENIYSLDLLGNNGINSYNNNVDLSDRDYTYSIGGTSAATAFVSGTAALILSKYPDLTQGQVRRAIELGCSRPSGYIYQNDNKTPVGLWNNQVGYGRVDAYQALQKAAIFHQENIANSIPGIDFVISNESSYDINNIYVGLSGMVNGEYTMLFSCDPGGLGANQSVGFPTYRGEDIYASPGTIITDLVLEIYAECPDYSGNVRVSAHIDGVPTIDLMSFDTGNTYYISIADTAVPNASRKKLFLNITNPLN